MFARILDKDQAATFRFAQSEFASRPAAQELSLSADFSLLCSNVTRSKQQYLPSTNILATKFLSDEGVGQVDDYMPLPASKSDKSFLPWLIRHVTTIRGELTFTMVRFSSFCQLSNKTSAD